MISGCDSVADILCIFIRSYMLNLLKHLFIITVKTKNTNMFINKYKRYMKVVVVRLKGHV